MILVIDKKTSSLSYSGGIISLHQDKIATQTFPINQLDQVVVIGNPTAPTLLWRALANAGVPTALLSGNDKIGHAILSGTLATQLPFRLLQYRLATNTDSQLLVAKHIIDLKLKSYALSLTAASQLNGVDKALLEAFKSKIQTATSALNSCTSISQVMGQEGQIAQAWFSLLPKTLPKKWKFSGRNKRPPRDPINALLSLSYTLLYGDIHTAIIQAGLDTSLGFLHQPYPGRESLVLDLTEPFRAGVDSFVLSLTSLPEFSEELFYYREDIGCRLSKTARPIFFQHWAKWRYHWPRPFASNEDINTPLTISEWPKAELSEIITGQLMNFRNTLKNMDDAHLIE